MRKNGGEKKREKKEKRLMEIVATTSFASSRPLERRPLKRRTLAPKTIHLFMWHILRYRNAIVHVSIRIMTVIFSLHDQRTRSHSDYTDASASTRMITKIIKHSGGITDIWPNLLLGGKIRAHP